MLRIPMAVRPHVGYEHVCSYFKRLVRSSLAFARMIERMRWRHVSLDSSGFFRQARVCKGEYREQSQSCSQYQSVYVSVGPADSAAVSDLP